MAQHQNHHHFFRIQQRAYAYRRAYFGTRLRRRQRSGSSLREYHGLTFWIRVREAVEDAGSQRRCDRRCRRRP